MKIHLLIPMSGQGTRYQKAGYSEPKPLVPVNGRPMIERLLQQFPTQWQTHFVMAQNHEATPLPPLLHQLRPSSHLSYVPVHTQGPGVAIRQGLENIPDDEAVLVSYCDYGMSFDAARFESLVENSKCDAALISYRGFHAHYLNPTTYAYSRVEGEQVKEVREKGSFTDNRENEYASCGAYYFSSAKILREALDYQNKMNLILNGESYTSLTVQALLQMKPNADVRVFEIPYFYQWGTPEDLKNFEYWENTYHELALHGNHTGEVDQLLMPMAGTGSRFSALTSTPKPFIPIQGVPMFLTATRSLPQAKTNVYVALSAFAERLKTNAPTSSKIVVLEKTPEGQALSVEAGIQSLNSNQDILISSTDHAVVLDEKKWQAFRKQNDCDAVIFTMKGFPGADRRPNAYAYVSQTIDPSDIPLVDRVSVKTPISKTPSADPLLVGTFWFKNAAILQNGIDLLKNKNIRVNGELYLDSVFDLLIAEGHRVKMFPLLGYINWGDPDSLAEALYWYEVHTGKSTALRNRFPGGLKC